MGTYTKNLKLETPSYTDNADIPALAKKNNEIIDSEMIKRANGLDYNEQTGVLQLTGNNSKVGSPIQIKNNLPVTSMSSGTELKVNNYKQLIKFTKEGKTDQKTYTGKNSLNYVDNLQSISGLTNTLNPDGSITTAGKPTADYTRIVKNYDITNLLKDGQKYTISQTDTSLKTMLQITAYKNDGTITNYSSRNGANILTINKSIYTKFSACVQTTSMSLWGDESLTINNKYMLCKGTDTADTSFEPYVGGQASPNPDYPQEIENIKGVENLFYNVVTNSTPSGITITQNDDGSLILNGTTTGVSIFDFKLRKTLPAGTYTFSIEGSDNISNDVFLRARDNNGQMVTTDAQVQGNNTTQNSHTFTCEKEIVKVALNITTTGKTFNNFVIKPMLSKKKSNYVPFGSNYLNLVSEVKNKFDYITNLQNNLNGLTSYINDDKSITISGKPTTSFSNIVPLTTLNLNDKTTYVISQNLDPLSNGIRIELNGVKKTGEVEQIFVLTKESRTFTTDYSIYTEYKAMIVVLKNSWGENKSVIFKPQIELGDKPTKFVSYKKLINSIDLKGNNLCSNKEQTLKDELVIENGRAKIIKKYDEYVFTGNETFSFTDNGARIMSNTGRISQLKNVYISIPQSSSNITPSFCTHYTVDGQGNVVKGSNKFGFSQYDNAKFIYFPADYSTIEEFKAKLKALYDSGNPVKVQYQLAEPKVIDLGEIDFDLIENSTLTCEEESDMQIDYLTIDSNIFVQDSLDGNSNQKAPSIDAIKKYFGKKVYDKDANGWIKIEFFDHIEYVYTAVVNKTFNSGWGYTDNVPFPVGVSSLGDRILTSSVICTDAAIKLNAGQYHNGKQGIGINYTNSYETALTKECIFDFRILEYK